MSALNSNSSTRLLPTPFQLALALVIGRSKPSGVTIKDFILALRKHIRPVSRDDSAGSDGLHLQLDVTEYWKSRCQTAEAKEEGLNNKASHHERQVESLSAELNAFQTSTPNQGGDKRKRTSSVATGRAAKRTKANDFAVWDQASLEKLEGSRVTGKSGRTLLQYIFNLHRLLRHGVRDRDELVCVIQKACSMAWATISTICRSCLLPGPAKAAQPVTTTDDIDAIFVALSRIIQILLRGYELVLGGREAQADSHSNEHGATAHSIISLFQAILTELSSCIAQIAPSKSSQPATTTTAPKPRSRRAKTSTGIVGTQNLARDLPTHLARLLHSFLAPSTPPSPATVTPPHADLHEGFLGLLLTQAGALLYTTTFATGPRAPCVPAEIAASSIYRVRGPSPPSSATNSTNNAAAANAAADDPDAAKRGAVAQAKYILPLLERLLARTRTRTRARDVDAQMVKVQNTLVRGVFGEDDGGAFGDVMRVPLQVEVAASMGRTEDAAEDEDDDGVEGDGRRAEQDAEWFLARMWEVCGWDVLARTTI